MAHGQLQLYVYAQPRMVALSGHHRPEFSMSRWGRVSFSRRTPSTFMWVTRFGGPGQVAVTVSAVAIRARSMDNFVHLTTPIVRRECFPTWAPFMSAFFLSLGLSLTSVLRTARLT